MKHTPGPWSVGKPNKAKQRIDIDAMVFDPDLKHTQWTGLARVYGCEDQPATGMQKAWANARLIAAAPCLLEALEACHEAMQYMSEYDIPISLPGKVEAAIKRARGE